MSTAADFLSLEDTAWCESFDRELLQEMSKTREFSPNALKINAMNAKSHILAPAGTVFDGIYLPNLPSDIEEATIAIIKHMNTQK